MAGLTARVPEDPRKPGRDVFGVGLKKRGHYIHEVLAESHEPLIATEIGERARSLASQHGVPFNERTYAGDVTGNHLRFIQKRGYVVQLPDKRWQLTTLARERIAAAQQRGMDSSAPPASGPPTPSPEIRTVDAKCRVLIP